MADQNPEFRVFIQARMSSTRFPGKVLAPLCGRPILAHVVDRVLATVARDRIVVATSDQPSDDPLALFARTLGVSVFRGPLTDAFRRFQLCLEKYPCPWLCRISADSPLLDPEIILKVNRCTQEGNVDLATNVFPRTFPRGHSVEWLRSETFARIETDSLTPEQKEHVTRIYYDNPAEFRIVNVESGDPSRASENLCVDTPEDLRRLTVELSRQEAADTTPISRDRSRS
jgi:spore coat polysaccharide biosynthesis protein SpsF